MLELSSADARRIALASLGFARTRSGRRPAKARLLDLIRSLGLLQIDSVNVLARAHHLPAFSRLGPYDVTRIDRLAYTDRALFEYWGHEASLLPVETFPLLRWRMERAERSDRWAFAKWARAHAKEVDAVYAEVKARGPIPASELTKPGERGGPWWGWAQGKASLEWLFMVGRITAASRRNFERLYDLTERVLPAEVLRAPTPTTEDAHRALVAIGARALGVGTAGDLADYFRITQREAKPRIAELIQDGVLQEARVEGWAQPAYVHRDASRPRRVAARALVSPFDPLVWERARTERMLGFRYRIEIYTPAPKRVYGYYVLPFLLGESIVARVDLKADRKARALLVQAAFAERGVDRSDVASALARELALMGEWLGLDSVVVAKRGDLSAALRAAVR